MEEVESENKIIEFSIKLRLTELLFKICKIYM